MEQVTPSRMNLQIYKQKMVSAKKGHELLKKKCDALKAKIREIANLLLKAKYDMGEISQEASLLYAKAQWGAGDFNQKVTDSVQRAIIRVDTKTDNIAGVHLPNFVIREQEDSDSNLNQIGLDRGGQSIKRCQEKFRELMMKLIQIASLQTSYFTLEEKIKVTNRRVNALEYVMIPKILNILVYINQELDESYREDFGRLKKVLEKKREAIQREEADKQKQLELLEKQGVQVEEVGLSAFEEKADEDIVF